MVGRILKRFRLSSFHHFSSDERGSAIVEFIALGIPLFLPLSIFLTSVHHDEALQSQARNIARQIARVYVTSSSEEIAIQRVNLLESTFQREIWDALQPGLMTKISVSCANPACLTPGSTVNVEVEIFKNKSNLVATAKVREFVDQWKSG